MITYTPIESAEIEELFDKVWNQVKDSPRYIYLRKDMVRYIRMYLPRPNRCKRVYKLRSRAKTIANRRKEMK